MGKKKIRDREDTGKEMGQTRVYNRICIYIHIYIICVCVLYIIVVLAGIRHPINLLLANRLANCERMLARANKGASIY